MTTILGFLLVWLHFDLFMIMYLFNTDTCRDSQNITTKSHMAGGTKIQIRHVAVYSDLARSIQNVSWK